MQGACADCVRNSAALAALGAHLDQGGLRARPEGVLAFTADQLIEELGGRHKARLRAELRPSNNGGLDAHMVLDVKSACRHQGAFDWPSCLVDDPEPPWVLYVRGNAELIAGTPMRRAVALVGSRKANAYGRSAARLLGQASAGAGCVVVSGLAFGVDAEAHRGALAVGTGLTVAVVGGGVDTVYPRSNSALHAEIARSGCVVSEMPLGTGVWKWSFPARNRLIAAFAQMTVVVQAAQRSGSLHTAEAALLRGRTVAAVPGQINEKVSAGSNLLLGDGALAILSPVGLTEALGFDSPGFELQVPAELESTWTQLLDGNLEEIFRIGGDKAAQVALDLTRLELLGMVQRLPGGNWLPVGERGGSLGSAP